MTDPASPGLIGDERWLASAVPLLLALQQAPASGVLLIGDALLRERAVPVFARVIARGRGRIDVARSMSVRDLPPDMHGLGRAVVGAAAELWEPGLAVAVARAPFLLVGAGRADEVHPALRQRCTVWCDLDDVASRVAPQRHEAGRARTLDPPSAAALAVAMSREYGLTEHPLDIGAARIARAAARCGSDAEALIRAAVYEPRRSTVVGGVTEPLRAETETDTEAETERERTTEAEGGADGPAAGEVPSDERPRDARAAAETDSTASSTGPDRTEETLAPPDDPRRPASPEPSESISLDAPRTHEGAVRNVRNAPPGRSALTLMPARTGRSAREVAYGRPDSGFALVSTIRRAAPWQRSRRARAAEAERQGSPERSGMIIRPEDLRATVRKHAAAHLHVFVVDASGSMPREAIRRAKALALAVLDRAYAARDEAALVVVRGPEAVLGMAPTRSVARVRASLRRLPAGGGTPLASGLLLAARVAARYDPEAVHVHLFTDGRANVGVGGDPVDDAIRAAYRCRRQAGALIVHHLETRARAGRRHRGAPLLEELARIGDDARTDAGR